MASSWAVNPTQYKNDPTWALVDTYTFSRLHPTTSTPSPDILSKAIQNSYTNNLPHYEVSPSQGKFLMLQARLIRAKNILEIGTLGGYSTIWLANATPETRVTTLEINEEFARVARENWRVSGADVEGRIECVMGSALGSLEMLEREVEGGERGRFDMAFIDADKEHGWEYFDAAVRMCRSGAVVFVDNVVMKGSLVDEAQVESNAHVKGSRALVEAVGRDERVDGVVLQTVGEKIYDGFVMAVIK